MILTCHRLEIENARLEATVKQQNNRIEILQKEAQEATAVSTGYFITDFYYYRIKQSH